MNPHTVKILFVDDEQSILKSLQHLMADEKWHCYYASSAQEALDLLTTVEVDLLVSDVMMPGIDGIELLTQVKKRYPKTVRIFLTAYAKQGKVVTALAEGNAQQIIPKPWIDQELKEVIRSALRQSNQQKKFSGKFQTLLNSMPLLPPLPESYAQVQSCISADEVDIEKMAIIIGQDVAMSTALLHWANSALFGQRFRVDTIKKAIVVLGTDIVVNLVLSEAVSQSVANTELHIDGFDLKNYKAHSIATAIIARLLIKALHASDSDLQDKAFVAGLLHDMGKLIEANHIGKSFSAAVQHAEKHNCSLAEAEKTTIGTSHAELGSFLAEWWTLPHFIGEAILLHHQPKASSIEPQIVNAVYLANQLSYRLGFGCNGEKIPRDIDPVIWNKFYLTEEGLEILQAETETVLSTICY